MSAAVMVGILAGCGIYMVLQKSLVRITLGFVLLAHAVNLLLVASGGTERRGVPFVGKSAPAADPLPQAFALTAIVISFAVTAFLLALAYRGRDATDEEDD